LRATDEELLYGWANDLGTRSNAIQTQRIDWEAHRLWFARRLANPDRCQMYIGELSEDLPCGQVRFERQDDGTWIIDYAVAPEFRGIGLGTALLESALGRLAMRQPGAIAAGYVKRNNTASRRVFEKLGFQPNAKQAGELIGYLRHAARSTTA
jgi:RimJ/RimL family protein N-acetyltransferase